VFEYSTLTTHILASIVTRTIAPGATTPQARRKAMRDFINARLGSDGIFRPDQAVITTIARVMTKTTTGLLFHEYGRLVPIDEIEVIAIEHAKNVDPSAFAEQHRRDDALSAEVTPTGRELTRQVIALYGHKPPYMSEWRVYLPEFFEYMFVQRSNGKLLTVLKLHDALTVLLECPWPSAAGPRRRGKPPGQNRW